MSGVAWRCVSAAVTGVSHQRQEQPCQDAFAHQLLPTGEWLVAVSDGAGSAARAGEGSALVVTTAIAAMSEVLTLYCPTVRAEWEAAMKFVFARVRQAVLKAAKSAAFPPRDYAATLLLAVVTGEQVVCGLVGDCAVVVQDMTGALVSLCQPQRGEYANTTNFVIQSGVLARLEVQVYPVPVQGAPGQGGPVQGVALFSDGLLELALNVAANRPYKPFFEPLFAFAAAAQDEQQASADLAAFLDSPRINGRTHDDKTLVLLSRI